MAASLVKVTYRDVKPPLLDLRTAVQQKSFFTGAAPDPLIVGNPDGQSDWLRLSRPSLAPDA